MTRYLVTGGAGFIGSAVVRRLLRDGHEVRVLDDSSRGRAERLADVAGDVELHTGDVRDVTRVTEATAGVDAVVHLAAVNGTENFYTHPERVLDVAIRGMLAVVDACRANDVGELFVASSSEVYQTPARVPTAEDVPLTVPDVRNPRYSYGGGKIASELIAFNHGRSGFDRVVVFRPHNVYGPDMGDEHVIPQLAVRASRLAEQSTGATLRLPIKGDGLQTRSFVHVDDFTDALARVIACGDHLGIYHIGNPEQVTIAELARRIVGCLGHRVELVTSEAPRGETAIRCPDISTLRALGFEPRIDLDSGLPPVVEWYRARADLSRSQLP